MNLMLGFLKPSEGNIFYYGKIFILLNWSNHIAVSQSCYLMDTSIKIILPLILLKKNDLKN